MGELVDYLIGFLLGVGGSALWWGFLLRIRPRVKICPYVLKGNKRLKPDETVYRIKVFNFGWHQVVELLAKAEIVQEVGGRWVMEEELKLQYDGALPVLGRSGPFRENSALKAVQPIFYFLILGEDNIKEKLSDADK